MRARWLILLVALVVATGVVLYLRRDDPTPTPPTTTRSPAESDPSTATPAAPLPGERLMANYGDPSTSPIEDLRALDRVISGYFSVVKTEKGFSIGGNEDLAAVLRGENAYQTRFLPNNHRAFGPQGRLLDRWNTPLFIHPLSARVIELRSAGPDKQMFTEDDVLLEKPEP